MDGDGEEAGKGNKSNKGKGKGKDKGGGKPLKGDKLTYAMIKMLLMNAQSCRELKGAVFMVFMIMVDSMEYTKMKEQLVAYNEQVQAIGKGHGMGPPSGFCFGGLIIALTERKDIGAENTKLMPELQSHWDQMTIEEGFDQVPHCRLRKAYDKTQFKLELLITKSNIRELIRNSLTQTGAKRLLGQAPEGGLEAALSKALDSLSI